MDIYTDCVVIKPSFPGYKVVQTALTALAVAALLLSTMSWFFLAVAALFALGAFLVWRNTEIEFEYTHTNHTLDIDKVMHNSRRKSLMTIDLNQVLEVTPLSDARGLSRLKKVDFTGDGEEDRFYAMLCVVKGERTAVLLQLDDRMRTSLKRQLSGKFQ